MNGTTTTTINGHTVKFGGSGRTQIAIVVIDGRTITGFGTTREAAIETLRAKIGSR